MIGGMVRRIDNPGVLGGGGHRGYSRQNTAKAKIIREAGRINLAVETLEQGSISSRVGGIGQRSQGWTVLALLGRGTPQWLVIEIDKPVGLVYS